MTQTGIEPEQYPSMEQLLDAQSYAPLQRGEIRQGEVIAIWPGYVVVDLNAKREGLVPMRDLNRLDEQVQEKVSIGAEFPVYVVRPENHEGQAIVSISRGLIQEDWDRAREMLASEEICEAEATGCNKGGLLVSFGRIRGFIPASQLINFPRSLPPTSKREKLSEWVGKRLGLRVVEVDQRRNRLVLSERAAYREWRQQQKERLLEQLEEGEIVHGTVSGIQNFGAFVDLGGVDGLVHISELSWSRVDHPRDVLQVGDEVDVQVINLDAERKRIGLSLRRAKGDPWGTIEEQYTLGQLIDGRVTRIMPYGAFVEVEEGIEGLLHISELSEDHVGRPREIVEEGEVLPLRVIRIDAARRRLGLSFRRVTRAEWEDWRASRLPADANTLEETAESVAQVLGDLDISGPAVERRDSAVPTEGDAQPVPANPLPQDSDQPLPAQEELDACPSPDPKEGPARRVAAQPEPTDGAVPPPDAREKPASCSGAESTSNVRPAS